MLSRANAELARRDAAVPGLPTLLDPEAFAEALRRAFPGASIRGARATYLRYKPGTSCLASYRLDVGEETVDVHATAYRRGEVDKLRKAQARPGIAGPLGAGRVVLDALAIAASVFPNDRALKSLSRFVDGERRTALLHNLAPERPELAACAVRTLRYKPERRYVAELAVGGEPAAVAKLYTESGYAAAAACARAFESRGALRIARWLGHAERDRAVLREWVPGHLLADVLADAGVDSERVAAVGASLAELHAQRPDALPRLTREAEAARLVALGEWLAALCPSLAARAGGLAGRLAEEVAGAPVADDAIHGDFYAGQVLLADDRVTILDLDEAARGDPAADLGLFIAHLERDSLNGILHASRVESLGTALDEGYRRAARPGVPTRVALYTAIGLFRLAPEPFRHCDPEWPVRTSAMLDRAEAVLRGGAARATGAAHRRGPPGTNGAAARAAEARTRADQVIVSDPFGAAADPRMPFLGRALDPSDAERALRRGLPQGDGAWDGLRVRAIRVARYKPGRRCLIEYDVELPRGRGAPAPHTVIGKVRARGLDEACYGVVRALRLAGFGDDSADGVSVPEPLGTIPAWRMWLQRKVSGVAATERLAGAGGVALAARVARALDKLHRVRAPTTRRHVMADELRILRERLPLAAHAHPAWAPRIRRILEACEALGAATPASPPCGIHRDFYADQVIVAGSRLYLVDFDLYCLGDPALDLGNFAGHIVEQGLRTAGDPDALWAQISALRDRYLALSGETRRAAVDAYTTLTLVRHVYISTRFDERKPLTEVLLGLCERRLEIARRANVGATGGAGRGWPPLS